MLFDSRRTRLGVVRNPNKSKSVKIRLEELESRVVPSVLTVDDDGLQNPNAQFSSIQDAIDSAGRNDLIRVYEGTYSENLTINVPGKRGLKLFAVGDRDSTRIESPGGLNGPIIDIDGVQRVLIKGFTIDGLGNPDDMIDAGIRVFGNGSATIRDNLITGLFNGTGGQRGHGIRVGEEAQGETGEATIYRNIIEDYQKGGIIVDGDGSKGMIRYNTITGSGGESDLVAQNGIQVSRGAEGRVQRNTVSSNVFLSEEENPFVGIGILIEQNSARVFVSRNETWNNDTGIFVTLSENTAVSFNTATDNNFDGISLVDSSNISVIRNKTNDNLLAGISLFDSSENYIGSNFTEKNDEDGIFVLGGSGNTFRLNRSRDNGLDGIFMEESNSNFVLYNLLRDNGGVGLSLINADDNNIRRNPLATVFEDADSTGNIII